MRLYRLFIFLLLSALAASFAPPALVNAQEGGDAQPIPHLVQPGDTWPALAYRYQLDTNQLRAANPHPNPARQPVIGDTILIPSAARPQQNGALVRSDAGGLLQLAARFGLNPWQLARQNGLAHPARPLFYRPVFIAGGQSAPRDLPIGFDTLELSTVPAQPGRAIAFRAQVSEHTALNAQLGSAVFDTFSQAGRILGLGGTGAFFTPGAPELTIYAEPYPLWAQPWRIVPGLWDYDQVTLTGEAAQIDQAAIAAERERLFQIWSQVSAQPQWDRPFRLQIQNYLAVSSNYGARRSYNGGPYSSYHEGVDFSAYAGTPVYASATGTVVLAEMLYVRGGAVIIDHGLGIYSGYYHMSEVHVEPGQSIPVGTQVGEVGTTGLSSGNHLHWDLLVAQTWVDASAWRSQGLDCWILQAWGRACAGQ